MVLVVLYQFIIGYIVKRNRKKLSISCDYGGYKLGKV